MNMKAVRITLVSALAVAATACGDATDSGTGSALDHQVQRSSSDSFERPWSNVDELVSFVEANHDREGFGGMQAVSGRFTDVAPGIGMNWEESADSDQMIVLKYGDPEAVVESVHFTFEISQRLAPHASRAASEVTVGVTFDAGFDFEQIEKDYVGLGEVVLFLEQSPVFAYQPGVYGILDNGLMVGTIDEQDGVDFPLVRDRAGFVSDDLTVEDLVRN